MNQTISNVGHGMVRTGMLLPFGYLHQESASPVARLQYQLREKHHIENQYLQIKLT